MPGTVVTGMLVTVSAAGTSFSEVDCLSADGGANGFDEGGREGDCEFNGWREGVDGKGLEVGCKFGDVLGVKITGVETMARDDLSVRG